MVCGVTPMSAPVTLALIGFQPPAVKAGALVVHVHLREGAHDLSGSPALMVDLARPCAENPPPRAPASSRRGRGRAPMSPEKAATYTAAHALWISGKAESQRHACQLAGVGVVAFGVWLQRERHAGRMPYTKPNGKIL
jgi:hypothetical protein